MCLPMRVTMYLSPSTIMILQLLLKPVLGLPYSSGNNREIGKTYHRKVPEAAGE